VEFHVNAPVAKGFVGGDRNRDDVVRMTVDKFVILLMEAGFTDMLEAIKFPGIVRS
jgi:hypothetical protein